MTASPFVVAPWTLVEEAVDLDRLGLTEALLAVSNGLIGLRGNLEEGDPAAEPGVFLAGVHETFPMSYPERGYGDPEIGQALVNVPDGLRVRLLVDDAPLDVRAGQVHAHRRCLDLRDGVLARDLDWTAPGGARLRVSTARLASLVERSVAALRYEVRCEEGPVSLVLESDLVANDSDPVVENPDPQVDAALGRPYDDRRQDPSRGGGVLVHATRHSGVVVGSGIDHRVTLVRADGREEPVTPQVEVTADEVRATVVTTLEPGERLVVVKLLAYVRSGTARDSVLADHVRAHLAAARALGWAGLHEANRAHLDDFWQVARVDVAGDPALEQALRYAIFQTYQSAARIQDAPVGAKGLTGGGYSGHTFWDIEGFVIPTLTMLAPDAARELLLWRASTLDEARRLARELGLQGAAFPWRTIDGHEASGYWPASTAAMHVNADVARAMDLFRHVRGEDEFERVHGLVVLVETARLWVSLGHHDRRGAWHLFGLTGPDEYTAVVDDNVFTLLMAARNLRAAAQACARHPEVAQELGVTPEETARWLRAADAAHVPYDEELGVHPACASFTCYEEWDFEGWGDRYPVQEHAPYMEIYRRQVIKQADLVHALWWCGDSFTDEQVARDLDYYERRTVRDSSLSAAIQAVVCVQAGHVGLGRDYLREAALVDLQDRQGNTELGLHLASLAGAWLALTAGLGGLREDAEDPRLSPRLPEGIDAYSFGFRWRAGSVRVTVGAEVRIEVTGLPQLAVVVYGERHVASPGEPLVVALQEAAPLLGTPTQPPGRSPRELADG